MLYLAVSDFILRKHVKDMVWVEKISNVNHPHTEPLFLLQKSFRAWEEVKYKNFAYLDEQLLELTKQCLVKLQAQGFSKEQVRTEPYLHLRYLGTDCALMCGPAPGSSDSAPRHGDFLKTFLQRYQSEFGFTLSDRTIMVDDIRVRGIGQSLVKIEESIEKASGPPPVDT
ncbi:hypothetical protein J6590_106039, partial [Homalodisca vitripennis]